MQEDKLGSIGPRPTTGTIRLIMDPRHIVRRHIEPTVQKHQSWGVRYPEGDPREPRQHRPDPVEFTFCSDEQSCRHFLREYPEGGMLEMIETTTASVITIYDVETNCGARHPHNSTVLPCQRELPHEEAHFSTSGCAGGEVWWAQEETA